MSALELLNAIRRKPKTEFHHGVVKEVSDKDNSVTVLLSNGITQKLRYNVNNPPPQVGDKLLVGGDRTRFIINPVDHSIPKDTAIIIV